MLVFPVQYDTPLASFDYLPGWKLLWNDSPEHATCRSLVDILLLLLAAYGLVMLFRRKQFGTLVGYGAVLGLRLQLPLSGPSIIQLTRS